MMATFAVIKDELVVNNILADTKQIAEEVTGLLCIENNNGAGNVGDTWDGSSFIKPYIDPAILNKSDIVVE